MSVIFSPCRTAASRAGVEGSSGLLRGLFRAFRGRLLVAYALVMLENLFQLAQPWALGLAINDLLRSSHLGLSMLSVLYLCHLLISTARRAYYARAFTRIHADLATRLVLDQRGRDVLVSYVAARSAMSGEFVQFFQVYLPLVLQAVCCLGGALVMLFIYDRTLMVLCLCLVVPACLVNFFYSRKVMRLNACLHDQLEQEVGVISTVDLAAVQAHYQRLSIWRIRLADAEALNFGAMEWFVIVLLAVALLRTCSLPGIGAGDILAVFRYVVLYIGALDGLPLLIQHLSRLRDIGRRMQVKDTTLSGDCRSPSQISLLPEVGSK